MALRLSAVLPRRYRAALGRRSLALHHHHHHHDKWPARGAAPEPVSAVRTSLDPLDSWRRLRQHRWSVADLQYLVLAAFVVLSLALSPGPAVLKLAACLAAVVVLLVPLTRQFFLPSLSIWAWLLYFFTSRFIPAQYRPHIWVRVLPALENVLYGANLSNILSAHTHPVLDVLAWLPYGIVHFAAPAICCLVMFLFAAPGTTPVFARAFGWMNLLGVTIQLVFPCTPPWYENMHGLAPAAYGMAGSPAGLARIDKLFGADMYTTSFSTAPVPFGAFPSLHAGNATLEALFLAFCFPRLRPLFAAYVCWIWWATMYLSHHYAVDLVGGSLIAAVFYYACEARWLPRQQRDRRSRWEYDHVDFGAKEKLRDEESHAGYAARPSADADADDDERDLELAEYRHPPSANHARPLVRAGSDEWTLGTASSSSSPPTSTRGSRPGSGSSSPATSQNDEPSPASRSASDYRPRRPDPADADAEADRLWPGPELSSPSQWRKHQRRRDSRGRRS